MNTAKPKILLLGKNGQVGWELHRTLWLLGQVEAFDYPDIDFTQPEPLIKLIAEIRPAVIVNACAYTAVDKAESEPGLAMQINAVTPGLIAQTAKNIGAWLLHFSTDYVFDGRKTEPYVETDPPNPLNAYGRSKLAGEIAVMNSGCNYLIFRLCWVYSTRGNNFLLTIKRLAQERETLRVVNDQVGTPTWARMIALCVTLALKQVFSNPEPLRFVGVYHLCCQGQTTWYEFARTIISLLPKKDLKCTAVQPISSAEYPSPAQRPAFSVLNCDRFDRTFGVHRLNWLEALKLALDKP